MSNIWTCPECGIPSGGLYDPRCGSCDDIMEPVPCPDCAAKDAELAALKARTCATCRYAVLDDDDCGLWCNRFCAACANIRWCGAWEPQP